MDVLKAPTKRVVIREALLSVRHQSLSEATLQQASPDQDQRLPVRSDEAVSFQSELCFNPATVSGDKGPESPLPGQELMRKSFPPGVRGQLQSEPIRAWSHMGSGEIAVWLLEAPIRAEVQLMLQHDEQPDGGGE